MARKYLIVPVPTYQEFVSGLSNPPVMGSLKEAQEVAERLTEEADEAEPGVEHLFAIVEEAGVQQTAIVKKVKRTFNTSRSINKRTPEELAERKAAREAKAKETGEAPRKPGRKAKH